MSDQNDAKMQQQQQQKAITNWQSLQKPEKMRRKVVVAWFIISEKLVIQIVDCDSTSKDHHMILKAEWSALL